MTNPVLYFEDFSPGETRDLGTARLSADDIISFASKYDPQPFHLDDALARQTHFGGLCSSGWHTTALMGWLVYRAYGHRAAYTGTPAIAEVRWRAPNRPDTDMVLRETCLAVDEAHDAVTFRHELVDTDGTIIADMTRTDSFARKEVS